MVKSNIARCKLCGSYIDPVELAEDFSYEFYDLSPANIRMDVCGHCAIMAIDDSIEGVYFDTCECCGKEFDLAVEQKKHKNMERIQYSNCSNTATLEGMMNQLRKCWEYSGKVMCADCARKVIKKAVIY